MKSIWPFALVLLLVLLAAAVAHLFRRGAKTGAENSAVLIQQAVKDGLGEIRRESASQSENAIRAAVEQASKLNQDVIGAQISNGKQELLAHKDLIGTSLDRMGSEFRESLTKLNELVHSHGNTSSHSFGQVSEALVAMAHSTATLQATTQNLRELLASSKTRGQWGERAAEDVLRLAGFTENINYKKQKAVENGTARPDFIFPMPKDHVLYLDVKFPMAAYIRCLEAVSEQERMINRDKFLSDVKDRIKELGSRAYHQTGTAPTVDYTLLFLPNESVSSFIHENDPKMIDVALSQKIVLCSPLTLFTLLGVIRSALDNFMVEKTSDQVLQLIGTFDKEWKKFNSAMEEVGKKLGAAQTAYQEMVGPRRRMLERPLVELESLRHQHGLAVEGDSAQDLLDYETAIGIPPSDQLPL